MKSVFRSLSELTRPSPATSNHRRILLLNLHSHHFATKSSKPCKTPEPHKPSEQSKPEPAISTAPDSTEPRSWTWFAPPPPNGPPSPSPPPAAAEWARPSEIPFQAKVANSVNLIGYVRSPVRFHTTPGGSSWASTVITQKVGDNLEIGDGDGSGDSIPLWVPVIFEGDLAHVAASHLKENDQVYINGQLTPSLPHLNANQVQANIQVMAHDLNFIDGSVQTTKSSVLYKQVEVKRSWKNSVSERAKKDELAISSWRELLDNPKQWWDNRDKKRDGLINPKSPDFTHKDDHRALWLDSAPQSVVMELEGLEFNVQIKQPAEEKQFKVSAKQDGDAIIWRELIANAEQWWDYRDSKLDGLVNPKHPDFKRKDGSHSLWLSNAPRWVSSQLEGMKFDVKILKPKEGIKSVNFPSKEELWKDLVEHPEKWWDNRLNKLKEKAPDFRHKETGEALWLVGSPTWVLSKLPPPKSKQDASFSKRETLLS